MVYNGTFLHMEGGKDNDTWAMINNHKHALQFMAHACKMIDNHKHDHSLHHTLTYGGWEEQWNMCDDQQSHACIALYCTCLHMEGERIILHVWWSTACIMVYELVFLKYISCSMHEFVHVYIWRVGRITKHAWWSTITCMIYMYRGLW